LAIALIIFTVILLSVMMYVCLAIVGIIHGDDARVLLNPELYYNPRQEEYVEVQGDNN
jgi:hypothetical protein